MSACPSPAVLEELALRGAAPPGIGTHVATCAACQAQLDEFRENQRFLNRAVTILSGGAEAPAAPEVLDRVAGFDLLQEISRGGQGIVFRAIQTDTKRPAAVKMLLGGALATQRQQMRFDREIEIAARLHHPSIVSVFASGVTQSGRRFVAMEYVDGVPLDEYVRTRLPANARARVDAVMRLASLIAAGVAHAHTCGAIHRDLKPSNILVDAQGHPRILDFGLARWIDKQDATQTLEFAGTPTFAAPEQFSHEAADARSDVYSLGLILYNMLTGTHPYPREGSIAVLAHHALHTPPTPPRRHVTQLPSDVATIALKAIAKEPQRRYANASALASDIDDYLAGRPISARRDSTWYVVWKTLRRNRAAALLAGVALLASLTATIGITYGIARARAAVAREELQREHRTDESARAEAVRMVLDAALNAPGTTSRAVDDRLVDLHNAISHGWLLDRPASVLHVESVLADIFVERGSGDGWRGEDTARRAAQLKRAAYGPDDVRALRATDLEIKAMTARGRLVEGEKLALETLRRWRTLPHAQPADVAPTQRLLGENLLAQGRPDAAEAQVEQALSARAAQPDPDRERSLSRQLMARIRAARGEWTDARRHALLALRGFMLLSRDTDDDVLDTLDLLAAAESQIRPASPGSAAPGTAQVRALRDLHLGAAPTTETLAALTALEAVKRDLFGNQHAEIAETLVLRGNGCDRLNRYAEMVDCFEQAARVLQSAGRERTASTMNCLFTAAQYSWYVKLSESPQAAARGARLALEGMRTLRGLPAGSVDETLRATHERMTAIRLLRANLCQQSEEYFRAALARFQAQSGEQGHTVALVHSAYADMLRADGRFAEAHHHARLGYELAARAGSTPGFQREPQIRALAFAALDNADLAGAVRAAEEWRGPEAALLEETGDALTWLIEQRKRLELDP